MKEFLDLVNGERRKANMPSYCYNDQLNKIAEEQSRFLNGRVSHSGPNGNNFSERIRAGGFPYRGGSENVAGPTGSVKQAFDALWGSDHHRENMMRPIYTIMGLGRANEKSSWVQLMAIGTNDLCEQESSQNKQIQAVEDKSKTPRSEKSPDLSERIIELRQILFNVQNLRQMLQ
jgi:hypothetical protein